MRAPFRPSQIEDCRSTCSDEGERGASIRYYIAKPCDCPRHDVDCVTESVLPEEGGGACSTGKRGSFPKQREQQGNKSGE